MGGSLMLRGIRDVLCCPSCWSEELEVGKDLIICKTCTSMYRVVNSIPIMIPTNRSDDWVVEARQDAEYGDEYFQERIRCNNGWWVPSEDTYYRSGQEHNLRCGRWRVVDDIGKNFDDILLVDVGGGEGYVLNYVQTKYGDRNIVSIGYDISNALQQDGKERYDWRNLYFVTGTNNRIALRDAVADVVVSTETIEHVRDVDLFLTNINRILKERGRLYITTPNYHGLSYWFGAMGIQYVRNLWRFVTGREMVAIDKNRGYFKDDGLTFERILRIEEVQESLQRNGFGIVCVAFTQFLGEITFRLARELGIPRRLLEALVRCEEFLLEPILNRIHLAQLFGFTQVIVAEKGTR
jgi:ubiquinone/menaquinone biosynthesis C-methylase UbiE/uncharacterized protein YbaR (Trm112 family)